MCSGVYLVLNQVHQTHLLLAEGKQVFELLQCLPQLHLLLFAQPPTLPPPDLPRHRRPRCYSLCGRRSDGCSTLHLGVDGGQAIMSGVRIFPFKQTPSNFHGLVGHPQQTKVLRGCRTITVSGLHHSLTPEHHQSTSHLVTPLHQLLSPGPISVCSAWSGGVLVGSAHVARWARVLQLT